MAAGAAQSDRFMMGAATLMFGSLSSWNDLLPATNSIGLVKNCTLMADNTFASLTQGRENTLVFSALTGASVKMTAEVYEYTAQNLTYALSLDGSAITTLNVVDKTLTAPIASGDTVINVNAITGWTAGTTYIMLKDSTAEDRILVRKVTAINTLAVTLDAAVNSVWTTAATVISAVQTIPLGSTVNPPFLACKAAGVLPDGAPVEWVLPKVRITKGMTMAWNSEQWGNMPFEIEVMDLVPSDAAYSFFTNKKGRIVLP